MATQVALTTVMVCLLGGMKIPPKPISAVFERSDTREYLIESAIKQGRTLCDETLTQVVICEDWHSVIVFRYRREWTFTFHGQSILATVSINQDARGPHGQPTGKRFPGEKKDWKMLREFLVNLGAKVE